MKEPTNKLLWGIASLLGLVSLILLNGCRTLEPDGPYRGDAILFTADQTIVTSTDILTRFVKWEKDNRAALSVWPEVRKVADDVRRSAPSAIKSAIAVREAYAAAPDETSRKALETALRTLREILNQASVQMATHGGLQ